MSKKSFEQQFGLKNEKEEIKKPDSGSIEKPETGIKRTPQEIQELTERLRFVARNLSSNFNLSLIPGKGWTAGLSKEFEVERKKFPHKSLEEFDEKLLVPVVMTYPEKDLLERSEEYIFGVFRHEIGHFKHSDYRALMESQVLVKKEGYKPGDFFTVYNAWEDGRSNTQEGKTSRTAHNRLGAYLKEDIGQAFFIDMENRPLPIQYGLLCWAKGAESFLEGFDFEKMKEKIKDEGVLKAYKETQDALDEYLNEHRGYRAFKEVLWEKGWPVFKDLIDKFIEEEAKKKHAEDQKKQKVGDGKKQDQKQEQGQEQGQQGLGDEKGQKSKDDQGEKPGDDQPGQEGRPEDEEGIDEGGQQQVDWDDLSDKEKEEYRQKAREVLDKEEREFNKKLQPKSIDIKENEDGSIEVKTNEVPTEEIEKAEKEEREYQERERAKQEQIEQARAETKRRLAGEQERLRERMTGLTENERELYDSYYSPIKKYVDVLVDRLDEVFPPQENKEWEGGHRRGKRIDTRKLAREIPTQEGKFFERKDVEEIKELAFTLLIDVSGSMRGDKINEALKAAILMSEALSKKGIPFEILAFNADFLELKGFDDKYFGKKKMEMMRLLHEVFGTGSGSTAAGFAVDSAARRLQKRFLENDASGALIVFTDGQPSQSFDANGVELELGAVVKKWSSQTPLIGVGIGPGMEDTITEYFGKNGLSVPDIHKLPQALLKILEKQIQKFEKRSA